MWGGPQWYLAVLFRSEAESRPNAIGGRSLTVPKAQAANRVPTSTSGRSRACEDQDVAAGAAKAMVREAVGRLRSRSPQGGDTMARAIGKG